MESRSSMWANEVIDIQYFPAGNYRDQVLAPLAITLSFQQFDIKANVRGGGMTGQSESIRLALAKAISYYDPVYTMALQKGNFCHRQ